MEYVIVNEERIACSSVTTNSDSISFTVANGDVAALKEKFKAVTEIEIAPSEDASSYGVYADLSFVSATIYANDDVTVVMHIPSAEEKRISALEKSQAEQDETIAEIAFGGGEE